MLRRGILRACFTREEQPPEEDETGSPMTASPRRTNLADCCTSEPGTRRMQHAKTSHALESVATPEKHLVNIKQQKQEINKRR
ncbi:hypothetical protein NDU88_005638 [Pleurodeles waltl]|uniref:Uncharacterized protein n=1 Tax=Pleurodeles waltl TaxID=8319 RepID=A0AAV7WCD9_PLEWA|nr:hypothetical protein NDU88_005638 [Pleurodeles waltl]